MTQSIIIRYQMSVSFWFSADNIRLSVTIYDIFTIFRAQKSRRQFRPPGGTEYETWCHHPTEWLRYSIGFPYATNSSEVKSAVGLLFADREIRHWVHPRPIATSSDDSAVPILSNWSVGLSVSRCQKLGKINTKSATPPFWMAEIPQAIPWVWHAVISRNLGSITQGVWSL
jgi:hypothetical protein